jgi:hypothetical protein
MQEQFMGGRAIRLNLLLPGCKEKKMSKPLPVANSIASLDHLIMALPTAKAGQEVATWCGLGGVIVIKGRFLGRGRGYFGPAEGIRWSCESQSGMFGKGIAGYGRPLPLWASAMPIVK